eukprot:7223388-Prymnesium_polylepis.1
MRHPARVRRHEPAKRKHVAQAKARGRMRSLAPARRPTLQIALACPMPTTAEALSWRGGHPRPLWVPCEPTSSKPNLPEQPTGGGSQACVSRWCGAVPA